ncbi:MAG: transcriptional regulator, LacI family [Herbinix sp.]|jgi:LacI family transcriptional regulator|nr:transcriptional regulator, LacI family [Herbinix sp.]
MKKTTMQDVADALNISRVTVWKVLNNQPGVSDVLCNQILSKAREMGYFKQGQQNKLTPASNPIVTEVQEVGQMTVSVVVSRPESSVFWMNIIHQIAKELDKSNVNMMYTYLPSKMSAGYTLPAVLTNGSIQGMVVLNVYDNELLSALNSLKVPKIFLDMVSSISFDTLTGDLFLLEGKTSICKITNEIIRRGRTEIGFIGDTEYARTNRDRYEGFLEAMEQNSLKVNPEICLTGNIGIYTYREEIHSFLANLKKLPQAFVCVSDYVAHFLLQYLNDNNIRVPEDIAVSGYDGSTEYPLVADRLTTVQVQTRSLGTRLAKQLLYRIAYPNTSSEITYINNNIIYGESTNF